MTTIGIFSVIDIFILNKLGIITNKMAKSEDILKTA